MFTLHARLAGDSTHIGDLPLCVLLMINDMNYPWFVLVPKREEIREIYQLNVQDRAQLLAESCALSEVMEEVFQPTKMNVAALGNMVPQLHLHHVARFEEDAAWPAPVWGAVPSKTYDDETRDKVIHALKQGFEHADLRLLTGK
ncbi:MAG: diadenosine tetraphosphate (Ap4A) HIT family hydrolase [Candidatus Endobugula sp.]|jgi:diadenosine tetraphosphate (Ap4A) HIT family hydrolase